MKSDNQQKLRADRVWLTEDACDLTDFRALAEKTTLLADYPTASAVEKNVLIYDSRKVVEAASTPEGRRAVLAEISEAFGIGPGVVVFKRAYENTGIIDRASVIFDEIIEEQHRISCAPFLETSGSLHRIEFAEYLRAGQSRQGE